MVVKKRAIPAELRGADMDDDLKKERLTIFMHDQKEATMHRRCGRR
jgi:hypothetical protein